ncbi:MAG: hypothetical protein ABIG93_01540 [archaeon]|nr:hypothetical protein [Nanoarchaeota archaeon]
MKRSRWVLSLVLFSLLSLVSIPSVLAAPSIGSIWDTILRAGALEFLGVSSGYMVGAFIRILVWILIFTVFFAVLSAMGGDGKGGGWGFKWLKKNQAIVVAAVLATISAVAMPVNVLLAISAGWATAVSLILLGLPVVGIGYFLMKWPGKDEKGNNLEDRGTLFMKVVICALLLWILGAMQYHIGVIV